MDVRCVLEVLSYDDLNHRRMLEQLNRFNPGIGWGGFSGGFGGFWDTSSSWDIVGSIWESVTSSPPVVISEIPETWEEYEEQYPEYFEPILETRPGHVADHYPQDLLDEVTPEQEDEMAHDWGHLIRQGIGAFIPGQEPAGIAGPSAFTNVPGAGPVLTSPLGDGGGGCDGMTWTGGAPPKGYKVVRDSCGNGVLRKVRRRRRRRMLTQGDKSDIASIVSMVGKGQLAASLINRSTS